MDNSTARSLSVIDEGEVANSRGTVTAILIRHGQGDDQALAEALATVYSDLRRMAGRCLIGEVPTPTFDEGALVHEAFVRLVRQDRTCWRNRRHLFAIASRVMRRILVDRARARLAVKRGGNLAARASLDSARLAEPGRPLGVVALDDALRDLSQHDATLAQLVELRFFAGLNNAQIGQVQGVTPMTVIRRWRLARAWLECYLSGRQPR